jgi:hypothetical protein
MALRISRGFLIFHAVFRVHYGFYNRAINDDWRRKTVKAESAILPETDNKCSLPMQGHPIASINNLFFDHIKHRKKNIAKYFTGSGKIIELFHTGRL